MASNIAMNATNAANILSDTWIKKVSKLVPSLSFMYQIAEFKKTEYVSGKCFVTIYAEWPQGHTLMAPGSNQDTNPSNSPDYPRAEIPIPSISFTQAITYEQLERMSNDKVFTYDEIIPRMSQLKMSHVSMLETLDLYGKDPNGLGDIAAITGNAISITPANYSKGLFVDRGGGFMDVYTAGNVWTGQKIRVFGPSNNTTNTILIDPADVGKVAVTNILRIASEGQYLTREFFGAVPILSETTNLFGVDLQRFPLFKGSTIDNGATPLKFENLLAAMIKCSFYCDYSENSDAVVLMSPLSFGDVVKEVEAVRTFGGAQYDSKRVKRGMLEGVEIFGPNGVFTMLAHPKLKAQHALGLRYNTWISPGVCDVKLLDTGTGDGTGFGPLYNVPQSLRFEYKTYSQKAIFCHEPTKNFLIYNINPSASMDAAA